jgi:hypothetical protein
MRGWAIVSVWKDKRMILHLGTPVERGVLEFESREFCERIAGQLNAKQALGRLSSYITGQCYFVALPYPVVLEAPTIPAQDLDDIDPL